MRNGRLHRTKHRERTTTFFIFHFSFLICFAFLFSLLFVNCDYEPTVGATMSGTNF